jgi:hypothetical protein
MTVNAYVSVEWPARLDASAQETATSPVPAIAATTAQYWWIHPRSRGLVGPWAAPSTWLSLSSSSMAIGLKDWRHGDAAVLWLIMPPVTRRDRRQALPRAAIWLLCYSVPPRIKELLCLTYELLVPYSF